MMNKIYCPLLNQLCDHGYLENDELCAAYNEPIAVGYEFLKYHGYISNSYCKIFGINEDDD